ncbi:MAG TPA: DUF502 domain-containing protein [Thermodesulfobacteriota bacterium]|nr:DUF502 domain-containing protein [Deltaproteobacteria bacterium]HKZ46520.1 DUF502 domain-containing protein [Thermodesulfobacteriota bacterium]
MFKKIKASFKRYFIAGLLVVVPLYLTIYIFSLIVGYMDTLLNYLPESMQPDVYLKFHIPGLGVIFTIVVIFLIGLLATNLLGKKLVEIGDNILARIPFFRSIYKPLKQFMETFLVTGYSGFRRVVLVEFPSKGMYSVGFLTGVAAGEVQSKTKEKVVNVFLPTTPNPTTGFYILIPEKDIIPLEMSVEDAFKLIITGGMVSPENTKNKDGLNKKG